MDRQTKISISDILIDAAKMEFIKDDTGVMMARRQSLPINLKTFTDFPNVWRAILEIARLTAKTPRYFMLNKLPGQCLVPEHTDTLVRNVEAGKIVIERWHLPLITNPLCRFWEEHLGVDIHLPIGQWYGPVRYWEKHSIWNESNEERIHLVVDLE